ncbi:hypothetical protein DXG03_007905, partial [Asterophora parasitica]
RVTKAAGAVLGTTGDVVHDVLITSMELLEFVPVPGLASAARVLLNIWDALQQVDTNRLACLRLTERCADILLSVHEEVEEAGPSVIEELATPIAKLNESFAAVHTFLLKQVHRPFLKRYLKRDEILAHIRSCDATLTEALSMFGMKIQVRILKQVQAVDARRASDTQRLLEEIAKMSPRIGSASTSDSGSESTLTVPASPVPIPPAMDPEETVTAKTALLTASASRLRDSQILPALKTLHATQDTLDAARDSVDLRALMRAALQTSSDVEMLGVLQIGREEMPEAIKTLQRALERVGDADADAVEMEGERGKLRTGNAMARGGSSESSSGSSECEGEGDSEVEGRDTLDREFIESGIDALRRMSLGHGLDTSLPAWTITRYEVDRETKIGLGFFSDVYKGTWRGLTVAIKVLAPTTPRALFVREVGIWKGLRHRNVLELFGASSASGERPWFFVCAYMKRGSLVDSLKRVRGVEEERMRHRPGGSVGGLGTNVVPAMGRARTASFPAVRGSVKGGSPLVGTDAQQSRLAVTREGDLFRFMLEIARGMEYLHQNGVLHGDLKASNVLVDDNVRCVISDFGQSEMKSEAYRISGTAPPHGTLRWQAPELMSGQSQLALTPQMDVYAYAISCVEIVAWGRMPWPLMDDDAVRHFVLKENERPVIPLTRFNTPTFQELLRVCWHRDTEIRPSFEKIVEEVKAIRKVFLRDGGNGHGGVFGEEQIMSPLDWERDKQWEWNWNQAPSKASPDMRPVVLPNISMTPPGEAATSMVLGISPDSSTTDSAYLTAEEDRSAPTSTTRPFAAVSPFETATPQYESTVSSARMRNPEPVIYAPSTRASSLFSHSGTPSSGSLEDLGTLTMLAPAPPGFEGYESPAPKDEHLMTTRDERRYRLLLSHNFHPSLTLPLWEPTPVSLGAVGYLSKPSGKFVTLFNSFHPEKSAEEQARGLPSLYGYGRVASGSQRQDKRNAAQRGYDAFVGLLTFKGRGGKHISQNVSRRYSFPLRTGHKTAHMCTETTMYRYMESLDVPKKWFKANVDAIMQIYGPIHHVQKEDLFLGTCGCLSKCTEKLTSSTSVHAVIGTLDAPDYALFVSHNHPDGQMHFNVFSSPINGQPWGAFTTDTEVPSELGGPSYDEPDPDSSLSSSRVSNGGGPWDTVLISRLRFKPDVLEPTSL